VDITLVCIEEIVLIGSHLNLETDYPVCFPQRMSWQMYLKLGHDHILPHTL